MRIAVVSDIHSNLVALDAVLAAAGTVDAVWHLGDVVGYGPEPDGVVARLEEIGAIGVRGNHDAAAAGGNEIDWFNRDARQAMEWTRRTIKPETRDWLAALPERHTEAGFELVHGSPRQPTWEYIVSEASARANLDRLVGTAALHGHTHVPVAWRDAGDDVELLRGRDGESLDLDERRVLLNPGSVGQPRDGVPTASFLILEPAVPRLTWHRTAYDIAAVQAAMQAAGLPMALIKRLEIGA
jgi:diadenosine tetraphosphatase ApaH/serine/threonine PP2A family protein phosphatase